MAVLNVNRFRSVLKAGIAALGLTIGANTAQATTTWYLADQHCITLEQSVAKAGLLPVIHTPEDLIAAMRVSGHQMTDVTDELLTQVSLPMFSHDNFRVLQIGDAVNTMMTDLNQCHRWEQTHG